MHAVKPQVFQSRCRPKNSQTPPSFSSEKIDHCVILELKVAVYTNLSEIALRLDPILLDPNFFYLLCTCCTFTVSKNH